MWNLQPYQVHFLYFITLKSTGISCTLKKIFYPCIILLIFCSVFWSFGKDKFTELGRSPERWHISLHNIKKKKSHLLTSPSISSEESLRLGNDQAHGDGYTHLKSLIFTQKFELYRWWQLSSAVLLELTHSLVIGEHIVAKYPTLTIVAPLCKKGVHKKKKS